jgi:glycosyltransferase involved in cell wall biosynthesis
MKICHISDKIPLMHNNTGGAEWAAYRIINAQKKKLDVFTITSTRNRDFETGLKIYEVPVGFDGIITDLRLGILPFNRIVYKKISDILKKEKPDIVHLHNFKYFGFSALKAAKDLEIKVIHSVYDYWLFCPLSMLYIKKSRSICHYYHGSTCMKCFSLPGVGFYFRKFLFEKYVKLIDHFFVISEDSKKILIDNGINGNRITVSSLIVDDIKIPKKSRKIKNSILYAGWIVPHKGLDVLIRGLEGTNYNLIVAGDGSVSPEYFEECKDLANELNVNVEFLGKIPNPDVIEWMSKCEFLAIPEQWRIPLPTVMIEAMSVGSKVIGSNKGCIKYFLPKQNLFNSEKDLVKSIKSAKFLKKKHDNRKVMSQIVSGYRNVLKEK